VRLSFLTEPLRRFRRKRGGNVAIIFALSAPVVFFAVAIAIDYTNASVVQSRLNAAADAAALAALTPTVLQENDLDAKQVATAMFNARASAVSTLVPGSVTPNVSVNPSANNAAIRVVTVSYTAQVYTIFGFINSPNNQMTVSGTSTAQASVPPNINFYLLLDNSPSMQLPSTQAGIQQMEGLTPLQDQSGGVGGTCAFACHQASTNNSDTMGNPCSDGANPPNYSSPTVTLTYSDANGTYNIPNALCAPTNAQSQPITQIDNFALSRQNNIQLRLDELSLGVTTLMQTAFNYQNSGIWSTPPKYQFAAYEMDFPTAVGTTLTGNNLLMGLTKDFTSAWSSASANFGVMEMFANNSYCAGLPPGCDSGLPTSSLSDTATNYDAALSSINSPLIMPNPGNGTNVNGDTPQEVLFFVTDGVEDEASLIRLIQPINADGSTNYCTQIKGRGIKIAILYTEYFPVTSNAFYNNNVAPIQSQIGPALQACASPGLYIDAQIGDDLGHDLAQLFQLVVQSAALSN